LSGALLECSFEVSFDVGFSGKIQAASFLRCRIRMARQEATPVGPNQGVVGAVCFVEEEPWTSESKNGDLVVEDEPTKGGARPGSAEKVENELVSILDAIDTPIFGVDMRAEVNEWNYLMSEMTGYSRQEVLGKPFVETLVDPRNFEYVSNLLSSAIDDRGTGVYELEVLGSDMEVRSLHINLCTRRGAGRSAVGVLGIAQDAVDAIKQDRAVAAMANELQLLIDTANAPIFGIDCDGYVLGIPIPE
jgi:PAS domain S-box-containing protein